jgi:hypothetical protein
MNYIQKYQKYINKLHNLMGGEPRYTKIEKNTIWFRTAPEICKYNTEELCILNAKKCGDTGKKGIYFGNHILVALAMCLEYDKLLEVGIFELTEDIEVLSHKYEFRNIHPERYINERGELKPYVNVLEDENVSHAMCELNMLSMNVSKDDTENLLPEYYEKIIRCGTCELFLTNDHIKKIKLVEAYKFNPDKIKSADNLYDYITTNYYPLHVDKYIEDKILIKFNCR